MDRKFWGPGPWDEEEDRYEWRAGKLGALITRGPMGSLCGYVGVPYGHPWYGKDYDDVAAEAHGGLTYSGLRRGYHEPAPHEDPDLWWVGFDCGHAGDVSPGMLALLRRITPPDHMSYRDSLFAGDEYRDVAYVRAEVEQLAAQAAFAATPFGRMLGFAYVLQRLRRALRWWNVRYEVALWFRQRLAEAEASRLGVPFDGSRLAAGMRGLK